MPQSDMDPPGPIPNPVVTHVSARWYCPSWAGEEAGAGTPARLPAPPVAFFVWLSAISYQPSAVGAWLVSRRPTCIYGERSSPWWLSLVVAHS